jgi:hypothetical protein
MAEPQTNGNGAPKSPYTRLAATDEAFATIEETLGNMVTQKAFEKHKPALVNYQEQIVAMRHTLASLLTQRFAIYEASQIKKLTPAGAAD